MFSQHDSGDNLKMVKTNHNNSIYPFIIFFTDSALNSLFLLIIIVLGYTMAPRCSNWTLKVDKNL